MFLFERHTKASSQSLAERLRWKKKQSRPIGLILWEIAMRLFIVVQGDEIVVTSETGFRAA
jgi:hypothetical protein